MTMELPASPGRAYAEVIGDPIAHSKSPLIHNFWLERLGIDADYRTCHVRAEQLGAYFAARRADPDWRGCNVTIPHKQAVQPFVDELSQMARSVGAANTVYRDAAGLIATNTDVDGVNDAICKAVPGAAVVIGAGGAARAAFTWLVSSAFDDVRVIARNADKANAAMAECGLTARTLPFDQSGAALSGAGLLINATQLGMTGQDAMPPGLLDGLEAMDQGGLVFDMVYAPLETALLKAAALRGLTASDGLMMLVGQAATAFERFFGVAPPREHDAELRRLLTS